MELLRYTPRTQSTAATSARAISSTDRADDSSETMPLDDLPLHYRYQLIDQEASSLLSGSIQHNNRVSFSPDSDAPPPAYASEQDDLEAAIPTPRSRVSFASAHVEVPEATRVSPYSTVRPATPIPALSAPRTRHTASPGPTTIGQQPEETIQEQQSYPNCLTMFSQCFTTIQALIFILALASIVDGVKWTCQQPGLAVALLAMGAQACLRGWNAVMRAILDRYPRQIGDQATVDAFMEMISPLLVAFAVGLAAGLLWNKCTG